MLGFFFLRNKKEQNTNQQAATLTENSGVSSSVKISIEAHLVFRMTLFKAACGQCKEFSYKGKGNHITQNSLFCSKQKWAPLL